MKLKWIKLNYEFFYFKGTNQAGYVSDYFLELKNECKKKREEAIAAVNSQYDQFIHKIELNEKRIVLNEKLTSQNKAEVLMIYLNDWIKEYNKAFKNSKTSSLPASIQLETNLVLFIINIFFILNYIIFFNYS